MNQKAIFFRSGGNKNDSIKLGLFLLLIFSSFLLSSPVLAQETATISGLVFEDLNLNNTLDYGEKPLSDWQVDLYQNDKLIQTRLTDSAGYYYFANLNPGNYLLKLAVPADWAPVGAKNVLFNLEANKSFKANFSNYQIIREKQEFGPMLLISNINIKSLSTNSAEIDWFTTHKASSQIVFSESSITNDKLILNNKLGYHFSSEINFAAATYHELSLKNLKPATTYYYRVVSLADPRQWRGAPILFGPEFSFTTNALPPQEQIKEGDKAVKEEIANKQKTKADKEILGLKTEGEKVEVTEATSTKELDAEGNLENTENNLAGSSAFSRCPFYILLLVILNLAAIVFVWQKNKESHKINSRRFWWLILIIVLGPTILGYPQCWLIVWLSFILIMSVIYLLSQRKRKEPPTKFFGPKGAGTDLFFEPNIKLEKSDLNSNDDKTEPSKRENSDLGLN